MLFSRPDPIHPFVLFSLLSHPCCLSDDSQSFPIAIESLERNGELKRERDSGGLSGERLFVFEEKGDDGDETRRRSANYVPVRPSASSLVRARFRSCLLLSMGALERERERGEELLGPARRTRPTQSRRAKKKRRILRWSCKVERTKKRKMTRPRPHSLTLSLSLSARPPPGTGDDKKTRIFVLG